MSLDWLEEEFGMSIAILQQYGAGRLVGIPILSSIQCILSHSKAQPQSPVLGPTSE